MDYSIEKVTAEAVRELRHVVLRPHQKPEELIYPKDDHGKTFHLGAITEGALIGIASFLYDTHTDLPDADVSYRIRGMATLPEYRRQGIGRRLIDYGLDIIRKRHTSETNKARVIIWCNAREVAFSFYERCGFALFGEMFDIPGIGPHKVMWRKV